SRPDQSGLME
uniref:16K protein n=1 Tax=Triticum turgidum TaxID=4571 RepID=Q7M278_TRITU